MNHTTAWWESVGLLAATTIGVGIFALPYAFAAAGTILGLALLVLVSLLIIFSHLVYWRVLEAVEERERLIGLVRKYLGAGAGWCGVVIILFGLLSALLAYLVLAGRFMSLVFPSLPAAAGLLMFWFLASFPLLLSLRRIALLEALGTVLVALLIFFVFFSAPLGIARAPLLPVDGLLSVSVILFSLAGWTAVEPIFDLRRRTGSAFKPYTVFIVGTAGSALLYLLFISGILGAASGVASDTLSGLLEWPFWKIALMGLLGLFAMRNGYSVIALEIKNGLTHDLRVPRALGAALVLFLPLVFVVFGANNFIALVSLSGGLFLGLEYFLILLLGVHVLRAGKIFTFVMYLGMILFASAAVYELVAFVVH